VLAGAAAALVAWWYVPFVGFVFPIVLGSLAWGLWRRPQGVGLARQLGRLGIVIVVSVGLAAPYVHEQLVQRRAYFFPGHAPSPLLTAPRWDVYVYRDFYRMLSGEELHPPPGGRARARTAPAVARTPLDGSPYWSRVQVESMPWDYLWNPRLADTRRSAFVAPLLLGAGLLGALVAGRRGLPWLAAAVFYWLCTLGPNAAQWVRGESAELLLIGDQRVGLPIGWLLEAIPALSDWLRPQRMFPVLLLCLCAGLVLGLDRVGRLWGGRAQALAAPLAALLAWGGLAQTTELPGYRWLLREWEVSPAYRRLADDVEDYAIAELPAGIGHASAGWAGYHGKRRSEPMHDILPMMRRAAPPAGCYELPFLRALWYLGDPSPDAMRRVEAGLSPTAIAEARAAGLRYVLVYPRLYAQAAREGDARDVAAIQARLAAIFGAPVEEDAEVSMYEVPGGP
jgi:hypothetical protein